MDGPLVTIVCLCYNHEKFVAEAIQSVIDQTYRNLQILVVDDASTDNSVSVVRRLQQAHPEIETLFLTRNLGNCAAFNKALPLVKGAFVVDFATDDVMMPDRIARQIERFGQLDDTYGVVFTDAIYIDENGQELRHHYEYLFRKRLINRIPEGFIYRDLLSTYFIASPTMLIRTKVLHELHGYDEQLSYEDFDFWIRSSATYKYSYLDAKLTRIRKSRQSMSTGWYKPGDKQLYSTYLVCKKAQALNKDERDVLALSKRLKYELRQSVFSGNYREADLFYHLLKEIGYAGWTDGTMWQLNKLKIPLTFLRRFYHFVRYR